jgi:hypothetical protein
VVQAGGLGSLSDIELSATAQMWYSFRANMNGYDKQKWFDLYRTALLELNRAAMTGRISDARGEIASRLERLKQHPGLHQHEYQAIQDALNNLRVLEREEKRLASDEKNRLLQESIQKLASVAPKFVGPSQQQTSN